MNLADYKSSQGGRLGPWISFSTFVVKLYSFYLSIAYISCSCQSTDSLIMCKELTQKIINAKIHTVLSQASAHGHLQLKCQKFRVGGYMENVLEWFKYPHTRAHPGCEVNCQGVPHRRFVEASPTVEKAVSCYKADRLVASLPSFRSPQSSLAVHKFCAAGKEHCE